MQNSMLGISLGGFQTFLHSTFIPLSKISLLYGPNSVGKSAISDVMEMFVYRAGDWGNYSFGKTFDASSNEMLERHWRRDSSGKYVSHMHFSILHRQGCQVSSALASDYNPGEDIPYPGEYIQENRWNHYFEDGNAGNLDDDKFLTDHEIWIDGEIVLALKDFRSVNEFYKIELHYDHPVFVEANIKNVIPFDILAKYTTDLIKHFPGTLHIEGFFLSKNSGVAANMDLTLFFKDPQLQADLVWIEAYKNLIEIINNIMGAASMSNGSLRHEVVYASRSVPSPQELLFIPSSMTEVLKVPAETFGGNYFYQSIMESLAKAARIDPEEDDNHFYKGKNPPEIAKLVNDWLSGHLFIDHGYRVALQRHGLFYDKDEVDGVLDGEARDLSLKNLLIRLVLVDSAGRQLLFDDVGSGIGYVLPVLISLARNDTSSFVQQPELHLHPALQAAFGDVLLDAASREQLEAIKNGREDYPLTKQFIVETHSEYILLRILKRIRQTNMGTAIAPELQVKPEDISVLYFSPQIDGTTTVKRLRISETGEFMDRWPKGFFAEREQELFDE
jgi:hypothetical protein